MSSISLLLLNVHEIVHDLSMKLNFSEPKIYTGGVDVTKWSKLSKLEQKDALGKDWYVYFSFRNPETGKLKRQSNIKAGANKLKTKRGRLCFLKTIQRNLIILLEAGFNPYKDNTLLEAQFLDRKETSLIIKGNTQEKNLKSIVETGRVFDETTIEQAFKLVLEIKSKVYKKTSFPGFKSNVERFEKWLDKNDFKGKSISLIDKKTVINYLNEILNKTSARTRNNTRTDLSSLFQTLVDNDLIQDNFVRKINVLKSIPKRHKTYSSSLLEKLNAYMINYDPLLLFFVKFISLNFLRPIEVCRLKIGDIDLKDKKIYVKAKNSPVKIKIIPDILIKQLPDLSKFSQDDFLFTPNQIGGLWNADEKNKRDYFTKRFKKVKDTLGLGKEYGLYSFRHTYITKLYNEFNKDMTPQESKSKLMLITGHKTMDALEKYLRDIDASLPDDYSEYLS